jgi:prepilin-type N-terminal cleavage/methylation domain-containing protein/prepilin-type processing-associated H-X9-DG protein
MSLFVTSRVKSIQRRKSLMSSSNRRSGFTLIELLVVIAIIAILAAILFPVFAQAKAAAKKAASLSNTKQLVLASLMYNGDYDDVFCAQGEPTGANGWGWQMTWIMHTIPYMKNYGILKDPSDSHTGPNWSGPMYSYVANGVLAGQCTPSWGGWKMVGVINASRNWFEMAPRGGTAIPLPAESIIFASRFKMHPSSWMYAEGIRGAFDPWASVLMQADGVDNGVSLPGTENGPWAAPVGTYDGVIATVYAGKSNFAFTDGHSKTLKPTQTVNMSAAQAGGCRESNFLKMWDSTREQ